MTKYELLRNLGVVSYLSNRIFRTFLENGNTFPENFCSRFKTSETIGGHDIHTIRVALKLAKKYDDYCIPELNPVVTHGYSQDELHLYFDVFDKFLDECLGPIDE